MTDRVVHVAAFYSSATRTVTVIDRGGEHDDRGDTILLTHELVHALQDDEISGAETTSTDGDIARRSMIEGEATLYENLTALELDRIDRDSAEWQDFYERWLGRRRRSMPNERSPYYATNWFVYPLGAGRLIDGYLEGGNAAVRHVLADPPHSTAVLMLFSDSAASSDRPALDCKIEPPGSGFALNGYDEFGGLHVYGFLSKAGMAEDDAWGNASRLTSDRIWIYFDKKAGAVAGSWRMRFGGRHDAERVAAAMAPDRTFTATVDGPDLLVRVSNVDGLLDDWPGAGDCNR